MLAKLVDTVTRLKKDKHKAIVRHGRTKISAMAEYVWGENHQMNLAATAVLAQEPDMY